MTHSQRLKVTAANVVHGFPSKKAWVLLLQAKEGNAGTIYLCPVQSSNQGYTGYELEPGDTLGFAENEFDLDEQDWSFAGTLDDQIDIITVEKSASH